MGTPQFAVPTLNALHESRHEVVKVVTQPDRPKGRGRKITPSPVKKRALELVYPVYQPESIKSEKAYQLLSGLKPDVFVVVAFGRIIPKDLLLLPKQCAVNLHASLLPQYRGPAPIQWAIINGENETGVTTMCMDEGMDTGDIFLRSKVAIASSDTSATLHDRLSTAGARLMIETLDGLADGSIKPMPQNSSQASYAPLLSKKDGHIDWNLPAQKLANRIRGLTPWPGAFTFCGNMRLKVLKAGHVDMDTDQLPGTVLESFPGELRIATGQGALLIQEIQGISGKCLDAKDFLCGCSIEPGTVFR